MSFKRELTVFHEYRNLQPSVYGMETFKSAGFGLLESFSMHFLQDKKRKDHGKNCFGVRHVKLKKEQLSFKKQNQDLCSAKKNQTAKV